MLEEKFCWKIQLKKHLQSFHNDAKKSNQMIGTEEDTDRCKFGDRQFSNKSNKIVDEQFLREKKPFECKICGSRFKYMAHKTHHELIHSGIRPFKCQFCEKTFTR